LFVDLVELVRVVAGDEQLCDEGMTGTYNSYERGTKIPTYGGYSKYYR
jgi:D-arabinose 1-dehydrogenase-like Zn-dependent alcohol dehydrogenase